MDSVAEVIAAADALSALLEAGGPRGLKHPTHAKVITKARARVVKVLRSYFERQRLALLNEIKPKIPAAVAMHSEASTPGGKRFANGILPSSLHPLRFPVAHVEDHEYQDAITDAIMGAARVMAAEAASGATISDDVASRYLRDNSLSKLTGNLNEASIDRLRNAVADAWDKGGSYDQIVEAIQDTFADFSDVRAGMIAQTEVNDAYNRGRVQQAQDLGFDEKAWAPDGEACEETCQPNVDQGYIGMDEDFESGDDAPPAHPNCDCSISFRKGAESPEEEEARWGED